MYDLHITHLLNYNKSNFVNQICKIISYKQLMVNDWQVTVYKNMFEIVCGLLTTNAALTSGDVGGHFRLEFLVNF